MSTQLVMLNDVGCALARNVARQRATYNQPSAERPAHFGLHP